MNLNSFKRSFDQSSEDEPEKIKRLFFNIRGNEISSQIVPKAVDLSQSFLVSPERTSQNTKSLSNLELLQEYSRVQKEILCRKFNYRSFATSLHDSSLQSNPFDYFLERRGKALWKFPEEIKSIAQKRVNNQSLIPYQPDELFNSSGKGIFNSFDQGSPQRIDFDSQSLQSHFPKGQLFDESQIIPEDVFAQCNQENLNTQNCDEQANDRMMVERNYIDGDQLEKTVDPLSSARIKSIHEFRKVQEILSAAEYELLDFKIKHFEKNVLTNAHQICEQRLNLESHDNTICYHVHWNLGVICLHQLNWKEAFENFYSAQKLKPDGEKPFYYLGIACAVSKSYELAIDCLKRATKKNSRLYKAYYAMGLAYLAKGDKTEALKIYDEVLATPLDDIHDQEDSKDLFLIKKLRAILESGFGFSDQASRFFQDLMSSQENIIYYEPIRKTKDTEKILDQGELCEMFGSLTQTLSSNIDDIESKLQFTRIKSSSASWSRRVADFIREIPKNHFADVYYMLAKSLYHDLELVVVPEKLQQAIRHLKEAIKYNPSPKYFVTYGQVEETVTRFDEAIAQYTKAAPTEIDACVFWGRTLFKKGQYEAALLQLKPFEDQKKYSAEIGMIQGLCYLKQENFDEALRMFHKVFESDPEHAEILSANVNFAFQPNENPKDFLDLFMGYLLSQNLWNESADIYWTLFFSNELIIKNLDSEDFALIFKYVSSNRFGFLKFLNALSQTLQYGKESNILKQSNKCPVYLSQFDIRRNMGTQKMITDCILRPLMPSLAVKEWKKRKNICRQQLECSQQSDYWKLQREITNIDLEICLLLIRQGDLTETKKYLLLINKDALMDIFESAKVWKTHYLEDIIAFHSQNSFIEAASCFEKSLSSKNKFGILKKIDPQSLIAIPAPDIQDNLDLSEIHLWLGQSYYLNNQYLEAIDSLEKAAKYNPDCGRAYSLMSIIYLAQGFSNNAFTEWRKAFDLSFKEWMAYSNWPERLIFKNEPNIKEKIIELYQKALQNKPLNERNQDLLFLAGASVKLQRNNEAIILCESILQTDPRFIQAYLVEGIAYLNQGKLQEALRPWEKSIEVDNQDWMSYFYQGKALFDYERYQEAKEKFKKCLQIKHDCIEACVFLCIISFINGDFETGISQYEGVYANPRKDWTWRFNYSKILLDKSIGRIALEVKKRSSPNSHQNNSFIQSPLEGYIIHFSEWKEDDRIYQYCQAKREEEPDNWLVILALAVSLLKRNQLQEAMVRFGEIFETRKVLQKEFQ